MSQEKINIITKAPNFSDLHIHIRGTWVRATKNFNTLMEAPIQYPYMNIHMLIQYPHNLDQN